ncbi:hypothetical protein HY212_06415 [Candidatus Pacearchaeota archaeon]|nr:hypothetical protein [Candidatus Pacearchaeota archaeon]
MYKKYIEQEDLELDILKSQLDPRDLFILGFLKGFNRSNMLAWSRKDLAVFNTKYS